VARKPSRGQVGDESRFVIRRSVTIVGSGNREKTGESA
jgi:hypothetical protein